MANWKYVKIGDVCTVERGGSPRPIDKFITEDPNGINWIKIGDTDDSMYIIKTAQKIIPEGMKKSFKVMTIVQDLSLADAADSVHARTSEAGCAVEVLVNNAGIMYCQAIHATSEKFLNLII